MDSVDQVGKLVEKTAESDFRFTIETFLSIWNFQLFAVEGSPITLGKMIIGGVLSVFGYLLARQISHHIGRRLIVGRLQLQHSLAYTLEKFIFYGLFVFIILFVMQMLSIPITVFTVVGGALAIGIGFGSQNLVNNFISGVIVMLEQPIRVGDWIEVEQTFGEVEQIGSRSTILRTFDNRQTVIPNSHFLEKMFTNWTLANHQVGSRITVGVAYGSDVEKVRQLLLEAADSHPDVLKDPGPAVLFADFAESSLNFTLSFTIHFSGQCTTGRVASDLRFRVEKLFRENQISMPFPHRQLLFSPESQVHVVLDSKGDR